MLYTIKKHIADLYDHFFNAVEDISSVVPTNPKPAYAIPGFGEVRNLGGLENLFSGLFFSRGKLRRGPGGKLHDTLPYVSARGIRIYREDPLDERPLVQRVMDALGCNRKVAQKYIRDFSK